VVIVYSWAMANDDDKISAEGRATLPSFETYFKERKQWLLENTGWDEIDEQKSIWGQFDALYKFRTSTEPDEWPGIKEPIPSVTFDISHYFDDYDYEKWPTKSVLNLGNYYKSCFRNILDEGVKVTALDWQHPCYRFDPYRDFSHWEIEPIPNGDYYIFLTPDLRGGFFGHPWEETVCVMGKGFVDQLSDAPEMFTRHPVRKDGLSL